MSDTVQPTRAPDGWSSRIGVVLAVAGSAVGLGNFLRFPGVAVNNGGGAFMVPYLISFLILGIPIAWCEWTIGRLGGRFGQHNGAGIYYALSRNILGRLVGVLTLLIPICVYMYYVLLEALCLRYCIEFASGGFAQLFADAGSGGAATVDAAKGFGIQAFGMAENGSMFGSEMLWLVLLCFVVNFFIIYRGVAKGIEKFCLFAMPLLILCAAIVLVRVLTLSQTVEGRTIVSGLGAMWNPDWATLRDPATWVAASGQIFFTLSVGFGLILCYSSYLKRNDDVVLTSLTASSTNEFCEVVLGGMIIVPAAFLFLGPGAVEESTFSVGFFTVPPIMEQMPGGSFFGAMWFGLLFLAGVTSSISMLQPAIAFLEDGFEVKRTTSVTLLGLLTLVGSGLIMYFSVGAQALDTTDYWCSFAMVIAALLQVIIFGWIIGATRGVQEANRGGSFHLPRFMPFVLRFVTPTFLAIILVMWFMQEGPERVRSMSQDWAGEQAALNVYAEPLREAYPDLAVAGDDQATSRAYRERASAVLSGAFDVPPELGMTIAMIEERAEAARAEARRMAMISRIVFVAMLLLFVGILAVTDIAISGRISASLKGRQITIGDSGAAS